MKQLWRDQADGDLDHYDESQEFGQGRPSPGKASKIMRKAAGDADPAPGASSKLARASQSGGRPIEDGLRGRLESFSGRDLSGVSVSTSAASGAAAESISAHAYTDRQAIHFAPGTYDPSSQQGQKLIAHEVAHTIQQSDADLGVQTKLAVSGPGDSHEQEADAFANAFVSGAAAFSIRGTASGSTLHRQVNETNRVPGGVPWTSPKDAAAATLALGGELQGPGGEWIEVLGAPIPIVGAEITYRVRFPPYLGEQRERFEFYCVNDRTHNPRATEVFHGPRQRVWEEARYGFPGSHVIVAKVTRGNDVFAVGIVQHVQTPEQRLNDAFEDAQAVSLESFETSLVVQEVSLTRGGVKVPGAAISCSGPNPAVPGRAPDLVRHTYVLGEPTPQTKWVSWYVTCPDIERMAREYYGYRKVTRDGKSVYTMGGGDVASGGDSARWIIASKGTYTITCEERDARSNVVRTSDYIQRVVYGEEAETIANFREYQQTVTELGADLEEAAPITAVYVNKESGSTVQLNLYTGISKTTRKRTLMDLTPGVPRRRYDGNSPGDLVESFDDLNSYPEGLVRISGPLGSHTIETDGSSSWTEWSTITGWLSLGLAVVAVAASATGIGATVGVPLLGFAAGLSGAASAGLSLAERLSHENVSESGVALDLAGIVTSLVGGALAARGTQALLSRAGRFMLYADVGGSAVEGVLVAAQYAGSVDQILDSEMGSEEKRGALIRLLAVAALQGAIFAVGMRSNAVQLRRAASIDTVAAREGGEYLRRLGIGAGEIDAIPAEKLQLVGQAHTAAAAGDTVRARQLLNGMEGHISQRQIRSLLDGWYGTYGIDLGFQQQTRRVNQLMTGGELSSSGYHSTNSDMLPGLRQTEGQILSEADLNARGMARTTGEGDAFSGRSGAKKVVSIGQGLDGMGTSLAYADVSRTSNMYNIQRLTYDELLDEIRQHRRVVELADPQASGMMGNIHQKSQSRLRLLETELELRNRLPVNSPRRIGGAHNVENYPMMFEFDTSGLDVSRRTDVTRGGALSGEASVTGAIDLRTRIRRVYVPLENIEDARRQLREILGHDNFEVIALEALDTIPTSNIVQTTRSATNDALEQNRQMLDFFTSLSVQGR